MDDEVTYKFADLSERAKDNARDALRYTDYYLHDEWWDNVFEDAVRMGKIIGIDISTTSHKGRKLGTSYLTTDISFSGFSSQGDGASFDGRYSYNPSAVQAIRSETDDDELLRIAQGLKLMQITQRLRGLEPFTATIRASGKYSHSGTMAADIHDFGIDEIGEPDEEQFIALMASFADWIYKQLEAEHDHLMSDDCVDEQLSEESFDEAGTVV